MYVLRIRSWVTVLRSRLHYLVAGSYRYFGNKYHLVSEYERAVHEFTRAVSLDPTFARAYMERGILYWRELDNPRRAVLDLTKAYDLAPTLIEARFNRGIAYQQLREYREAMEDFRAYLAEGKHPYWREYAEGMLRELSDWASTMPEKSESPANTPG